MINQQQKLLASIFCNINPDVHFSVKKIHLHFTGESASPSEAKKF